MTEVLSEKPYAGAAFKGAEAVSMEESLSGVVNAQCAMEVEVGARMSCAFILASLLSRSLTLHLLSSLACPLS